MGVFEREVRLSGTPHVSFSFSFSASFWFTNWPSIAASFSFISFQSHSPSSLLLPRYHHPRFLHQHYHRYQPLDVSISSCNTFPHRTYPNPRSHNANIAPTLPTPTYLLIHPSLFELRWSLMHFRPRDTSTTATAKTTSSYSSSPLTANATTAMRQGGYFSNVLTSTTAPDVVLVNSKLGWCLSIHIMAFIPPSSGDAVTGEYVVDTIRWMVERTWRAQEAQTHLLGRLMRLVCLLVFFIFPHLPFCEVFLLFPSFSSFRLPCSLGGSIHYNDWLCLYFGFIDST